MFTFYNIHLDTCKPIHKTSNDIRVQFVIKQRLLFISSFKNFRRTAVCIIEVTVVTLKKQNSDHHFANRLLFTITLNRLSEQVREQHDFSYGCRIVIMLILYFL